MTNEQRAAIVAFVSSKGGAGKSTNCLNLAASLAHKGYTVRIIDFDQTQTLWRWYSKNAAAQNIPGLTVVEGPAKNIAPYIDSLWKVTDVDFLFVDLPGVLTRNTLVLAATADLTISPMKLFEPDVSEATKLSKDISSLAHTMQKPLTHRLLINEVSQSAFGRLPTPQAHILDMVDNSHMQRFSTLVHYRPFFGDTFLTGRPPHFADQTLPPIRKAVEEIDLLTDELLEIFGIPAQSTDNTQQEKAAA